MAKERGRGKNWIEKRATGILAPAMRMAKQFSFLNIAKNSLQVLYYVQSSAILRTRRNCGKNTLITLDQIQHSLSQMQESGLLCSRRQDGLNEVLQPAILLPQQDKLDFVGSLSCNILKVCIRNLPEA